MTRYAIGDIHGGAKTFRALLEKIDLQREDRVYLLGDYVDRGPNSKGVLDIILKLNDAGFDMRPLRGNHEAMLIRAIYGDKSDETKIYMHSWGADSLKSFGITSARDMPRDYLYFLRGLPFLLEDGQFIFVHANLDMSKDDPITQSSTECMLWGNGGFISDNELPGRIIISGHRIRNTGYIQASLDQPHIQIDNGAFINQPPDFGHLVALNLDSMQLTFQRWIDKEATKPKSLYDISFDQGQEYIPLIKEDVIMNLISDEIKANRLARVMMDNIGLYEESLVKTGINADNIFDLLHDHIEEARMEYNKRVTPEIAESKLFDTAVVDVLIKRAYKHKTDKRLPL